MGNKSTAHRNRQSRIHQALTQRGVTEKQCRAWLRNVFHISEPRIAKALNQGDVSGSDIMRFACLLDADPSWLYYGTEDPPLLDNDPTRGCIDAYLNAYGSDAEAEVSRNLSLGYQPPKTAKKLPKPRKKLFHNFDLEADLLASIQSRMHRNAHPTDADVVANAVRMVSQVSDSRRMLIQHRLDIHRVCMQFFEKFSISNKNLGGSRSSRVPLPGDPRSAKGIDAFIEKMNQILKDGTGAIIEDCTVDMVYYWLWLCRFMDFLCAAPEIKKSRPFQGLVKAHQE